MKTFRFIVFLSAFCYTLQAQYPPLLFAATFTGATNVMPSIAIASNGDILMAGTFNGAVDFDPGPFATILTSTTPCMFVARYSSTGNLLWVQGFTGFSGYLEAWDIACDNLSNVYITGRSSGTIDFDPGPGTQTVTTPAGSLPFVLKLGATGSYSWHARGTTSALMVQGYGNRLVVDQANNRIIVGCNYSNSSAFAAVVFNSPCASLNIGGGGTTGMLIRYDLSTGACANAYTGGSNGALALDGNGLAVQSGFNSNLVAGAVSKINNAGNFNTQFFLSGSCCGGNYASYQIAFDSNGNIVLYGNFAGTLDFDPGPGVVSYTSLHNALGDNFLAKYSGTTGSLIWAQMIGRSTNFKDGGGMFIDANDNITVSCRFSNTIDVDPSSAVVSYTSLGNTDALVARYNANGDYVWSFRLGSSSAETMEKLVKLNNDEFYAVGSFNGTIDFDPGSGVTNMTAQPAQCIYVVKYGSCTSAPSNTNSISGNTSICEGSVQTYSIPSYSEAGTYTWTIPPGWTSSGTSNVITVTTTSSGGTITVSNSNSCGTSSVTSLGITVNPIPVAPTTATSSSGLCAGSTLTLGASGGANYSWIGPNAFFSSAQNPSISPAFTIASGTYSVTQTLLGCTSPPGVTTVSVNSIPTAPVVFGSSPLCAGSDVTLTASSISGATFNWTGPNGFMSSLQNPTITNAPVAATGNYSVTRTVEGCTSPANTVSITVNNAPAAPIAGPSYSLCSGTTLTLTASGGANYSWTGPNGFTSALQNPSISSAGTVSAGNYSVTQTVAGCIGPAATTSISVSQTPSAPNIGGTSTLCAGSNLSLTTNASIASFNWTGPNGFASSLQNPVINGAGTSATGVYSLFLNFLTCNSNTVTFNSTVNAQPSAPLTGSAYSLCSGNTLTLTASSGANYSWMGPNGFSAGTQNPSIPIAGTVATGNYSVTQTVLGCISPAGIMSVTVNQTPPSPNISSTPTLCAGANLTLNTSSSIGSYDWSGPNSFNSSAQNPIINGVNSSATGSYSLYLSLLGCRSNTVTYSVTVIPLPSPPVTGANYSLCSGTTLTLTANGASNYSWTGPNSFNSGLQNPSILNAGTSSSGNYSVIQTVLGCVSAPGTTSVTVNLTPSAPVAGAGYTMCSGNTLTLSATGAANYNWIGPSGFNSGVQNPSLTNASTSASGNYSVWQTVQGCASPVSTTSVVVNTTPASPNVAAGYSLCSGSILTLSASSASNYFWSGPNGFSSSLQNPTILNASLSASGNYSVTQTVLGCVSLEGQASYTVYQTPSPPVVAATATLCAGSSITLSAGAGGTAYSWTGPNSFTSSLQNPTITGAGVNATGVYSVTQTQFGCTGPSGTVGVVVNPIPAMLVVTGASVLCAGSTISLTSSIGANYYWSGPGGFVSTQSSVVIVNSSTTSTGGYTVTQTDLGCTSPASVFNVTVNPIPLAPTIGSNTVVCAGSNMTLSANGNGTAFSWTGPNGFTSTQQNTVLLQTTTLSAGNYSVTQSSLGCTGPPSVINVSINPMPSLIVSSSNGTMCVGESAVLTANGAFSYTWSPGGSNSNQINVSPLANTVYTLIGVNIEGCEGKILFGQYVLACLGVFGENTPDFEILVYPNPFEDFLYIKCSERSIVTVQDASGRLIAKQEVFVGVNTVNLTSCAKGIYFVSCNNRNFKMTKN